ncbi:protein YgfX [Legionella micdadei]|uniref:protein YgfX n=1 Tax=Legionella micdadei TaxID=451 RepID=UPI0032C4A75D
MTPRTRNSLILLNLSECNITLGRSVYYLKLALLIYLSALMLLFYSSCIPFLKVATTFLLLLQFVRIFNNPQPNPNYLMLSYREHWVLLDKFHQEQAYEKGRVVINTGLFFLFELIDKRKKKLIVIFRDQIDEHSYRLLAIIEKIQPNIQGQANMN